MDGEASVPCLGGREGQAGGAQQPACVEATTYDKTCGLQSISLGNDVLGNDVQGTLRTERGIGVLWRYVLLDKRED